MVGKTKHQTITDQKRLVAIGQIGCLACAYDGHDGVAPQVHHILYGGRRHENEHQHSVGLCPWHHQGQPPDGLNVTDATEYWGPSMAHNPVRFTARYGSQVELLEVQDSVLAQYYGAEQRGEFLPAEACGEIARRAFDTVVVRWG